MKALAKRATTKRDPKRDPKRDLKPTKPPITTQYMPAYKYRFRAGPYVPPVVNRGVTIHDEWLDKDVVVAGHTEAPIPWPAHQHLGKLLPILAGELVRAVIEEPEGVVAHYFGVSKYHVNQWRRALAGVEPSSQVHAVLALKRFDPEFRRKYGYR